MFRKKNVSTIEKILMVIGGVTVYFLIFMGLAALNRFMFGA